MKKYEPKPLYTEDVKLPQDLLELTETLARNVHEVWAQGRIQEGWAYGPEKSIERKTTPLLVPYEALPESERDYDRNTAMETLKTIVKLGYTIKKS